MKNLKSGMWTLICMFLPSILTIGQPVTYEVDALVSPVTPTLEISVGGADADIQGFDNHSIQYAIDAMASSGGKVVLTDGIFDITAPIKMRSNVELTGSGPTTILKKSKGIQTEYVVDADYGELKITVNDPSGFKPGMKIQVTDSENNSCWNVSTAYITDIVDHVIYIDDYLIRDYRSDLDGKISNASSVIEVIKAENVVIRNLVVDGNKAENYLMDGCNGSGIYIFKSKKVTVDQVVVKDFNGEGISWQITENVTVRNSEITGSGNIGLHPGTGSPLSIIENNDVHHNTVDGLFICWRVHHSRVTGNRFYENGRFGICTGHKDTDVIFEGNHIYNNGSDGVNLRGELEANAPHRNTFRENIIENNGKKEAGYGISFNSPAREVEILNNTIRDTGAGTQKAGLFFYDNASPVHRAGNIMSGHALGNEVYESDLRK